MLVGYNTNGFAHHRLEDALEVLAELGCQSVALTLDYNALDPADPATPAQRDRVRRILERHRMRCVIETGARFLLDVRRKHQPTLLDPRPESREHRAAFLRAACDLAVDLHADAVSFWSGKAPSETPDEVLLSRLADECLRLCDHAEKRGVRLAFEPEPGMFIDTMPRNADLFARVDRVCFGLTLDIGHLYCMGEDPVTPHVRRWRDRLWNVHIEDMKRGVHDHLPFGEGDIDFAEVMAALRGGGYAGGLHVELSRHSHDAVETARRAMDTLRRMLT